MEKPAAQQSRSMAEVTSCSPLGEAFGDFRILRKLGQGGMGQVFLAEQISLNRKVAIKMLRDDVSANANALTRFQAEAKTIAKLSHANIVQAYMVGEHDGRHYLVMEYVEGISLREYIERKGPLEVPLVLTIMRQVASALHRASEMGIVHRDIKPENILLTRKGEAKVADFGLSRCLAVEERIDLTRAGAAVGTPMYMSPEQIEGKPTDVRSDIYSLGVTCYQMLAGKAPFDGNNAFDVAAKHMREAPPALAKKRDDVPPALCELVHKMLAKKPEDRPATARALLQEVSRVKHSLDPNATIESTIAETPIEPVPTIAPTPRKPILLAAAAGIVVLAILFVLVAGVGAYWWSHRTVPTPQPEPRAVVPASKEKTVETPKEDPAKALKLVVDQHLADSSPKPAGVEACIDLAVLYFEQEKASDAETLFKKMCERKAPSAYYFVGRLGLAVTDEMHNDHRASQAKFKELFDAKAKDQRAQILNDYLSKKPEFAAWVNEADSNNVRNGVVAEQSLPKSLRKPMMPKFPFKKG